MGHHEHMRIPGTDLDVSRLCLGANVFGWTSDKATSFEVLDRYVEAGGRFIDTADMYSCWMEGNVGGESESIIGEWMASRGNRDSMIIATKVGKLPTRHGLTPENVRIAANESLQRLRTDRIDLYYAHADDPDVPLIDALSGLDALVRSGDVRAIAASNYDADRLSEALAISEREGLARFVALQQHYNLMERAEFEGPLRDVCVTNGLVTFPYFALARGFLSGKYRVGAAPTEETSGPRASDARAYLTERGVSVLGALEDIAAGHGCSMGAVALAWLAAQPTVAAPIASARTTTQLDELLPMLSLHLTAEELALLDAASA